MPMCLPASVSRDTMQQLAGIITQSDPLRRNQHLFRMNDRFKRFFVIRSGTLKTYQVSKNGREQITGFWLPGELVGLDGLANGHYPTAAVALERTQVCSVPIDRFEHLSNGANGLTHEFARMVGRHVVAEQKLLMIRSRDTAEERLALFLLHYSERLTERGFRGDRINLAMTRRDLARYLSLAVETVSRGFTRFRESGLLTVNRRQIAILDAEALKKAANI